MKRAVLLLAVLATLSPTRPASAHWTAKPSTTTVLAQAAHLAPPVLAGPASSGFAPQISFAADARVPERPSAGGITYTLERRSGTGSFAALSSGPCAGQRPRENAGCTDRLTADGTYTYRAVAHLGSWTATSAPISISAADAVPVVQSVTRADPNPTNAPTLRWRVHFSEPVQGVDQSDFALAETSLGGTPTVTDVSGTGTDYVVTATDGSGSGSVILNLADNDSIVDEVGQPIGGPGAGNGGMVGPGYTIDRTPPAISELKMLDANANGRVDQVAATFDSVLGSSAALGDWTLANAPSGAALAGISVDGNTATLSLTEGTGAPDTAVGAFTVALTADPAGIHDPLGNPASFAARTPTDAAGPVLLQGVSFTDGNGRIGPGDSVSLPFSEPLVAAAVLPTTTLSERRTGTAHVFLSAPGFLSSSDLGSSGYLSGAGTYQCSATSSVSAATVTLTIPSLLVPCSLLGGVLGTGPATPSGAAPTATLIPDPALTDAAGNPSAGAATVTARAF